MKGLKILLFIAAGCLMAGSLHADIYGWTDENGVKHFTNYDPPDDATILMKSEELPYDEAADRTRIEAERQQQLEREKLKIAAREARLERREAESQRKAVEAERYAEETVWAADQYLDDARKDRYLYRSGGYYGYYRPPHYKRKHHRNPTAGIYFVGPSYINHNKRKYRGKSHSGPSRKNFSNKHHPQKLQAPHSLRSRSRTTHGDYRVNFRNIGLKERSHYERDSYGLRR
jgi:hypothetical protein